LGAVSRGAASAACYLSNVVLHVKLKDKPKESLMQLVTIDNRHIIEALQKCPPGKPWPFKEVQSKYTKTFFRPISG